ncbi:hypothetical protein N7509_007407 [Penicillium cosmopolitanum]|uniref:Uncharacterized protein n=1 Tax=Penicillium cosmopolitanum TaxID=1131564 RepID=A0A9W9VYT8_9EURO|nr:uncharacterized protein N7509_007407 [Penicillium cosmopolitanum]KAJ5391917.1 hypothetical protein N7509_007407 [Penicillium cosmopolitanum]
MIQSVFDTAKYNTRLHPARESSHFACANVGPSKKFAPKSRKTGNKMSRPQPEIGTSHPNGEIPNPIHPGSAAVASAHEPNIGVPGIWEITGFKK